ncbi:hypothetical protein BRADI_2g33167v3 [Brachypodium distachyon]|uniref:Uncharacterized protein n=1 Tax=Brachypodium distachyon TaxID=15368 RepID=A0A0Q3J313_BRADI|nr:hypothetical protein BRADI_2g33167v3 [Brachypodium distachyon]
MQHGRPLLRRRGSGQPARSVAAARGEREEKRSCWLAGGRQLADADELGRAAGNLGAPPEGRAAGAADGGAGARRGTGEAGVGPGGRARRRYGGGLGWGAQVGQAGGGGTGQGLGRSWDMPTGRGGGWGGGGGAASTMGDEGGDWHQER